MTDEEAYRQGKRIADDMVRSGRAIRIGGSSSYGRSRASRPTSAKGAWVAVIVVAALIVLLVWLFK